MRPLVLVSSFLCTTASAADVDRFEPSASVASGNGSLQGESPFLGVEGGSASLWFGYAKNLVVRRLADDTTSPEVASFVPAMLAGGWTQGDRFRIDVEIPFYLVADAPLNSFEGSAIGDIALQGTIPVWNRANDAVSVAIVPHFGLPTGSDRAVVTRGTHGGITGALGGRWKQLGWVGNAGFTLAKGEVLEAGSDGLGSTIDLLAGGWWQPSAVARVGAEVDLDLGLAGGDTGANQSSTIHGFFQYIQPTGFGFTAGAGTGLIGGLGTPSFRLVAAATWQAQREEPTIHDVEPVAMPEPPTEAEPEPPAEAEPEPAAAPEPEPVVLPPPELTRVAVAEHTIDLLAPVAFVPDSFQLEEGAQVVLDELVAALAFHTDITLVEIQAHTDSEGDDDANMALSQNRADTVRAYLIDAGISSDRLIARGYGETLPVATNRTPQGRERNRRVVLATLEPSH